MHDIPHPLQLNEISKRIRTPETHALLTIFKDELQILNLKVDLDKTAEASALRHILTQLNCAMLLFESNLFFVVIFGALKSGKSTLTNCLVEREISPMGYGVDTTQRPCLILRGEKEQCCQYFMRHGGDRQYVFDLVIDYLKGVIPEDALHAVVDVKYFPLDSAEIHKRLAAKPVAAEPEPLITVVWVKSGKFLDYNTCLVDMPGLDSVEQNAQENHIHDWIVSNADFFLFLQSSIAAINQQTEQFLRKIHTSKSHRPMWALQNRIEGRYWRDPKDLQKEAEAQQRESYQRIRRALGPDGELFGHWFNLGLEWDGIEQKNEAWKKDSCFAGFKQVILDQLSRECANIKERNCLERIDQTLVNSEEVLERFLKQQREIAEDYQKRLHLITSKILPSIASLCFFNESRRLEVYDYAARMIDDQQQACMKKLAERLESRRAASHGMNTSEMIKLVEHFILELKGIATKGFHSIGTKPDNFDSYAKRKISEAFRDETIEEIDLLWKQVDGGDTGFCNDTQNLLPGNSPPLEVGFDIAIKHPWKFWGHYNADEIGALLTEHYARFIEKFKMSVESLKNIILTVFEEWEEKRREYLKALLTNKTDKYKAREEARYKAATVAIQNAITILSFIHNIRPVLENAQRSIRS
ncbi:MAG: dynamin family protein [Candidatus Methylacidiphilales bacterium]|nr:dynamin family protein [Candidatus Methylacidiphilales bacterium]